MERTNANMGAQISGRQILEPTTQKPPNQGKCPDSNPSINDPNHANQAKVAGLSSF
jgi:hypothetical protein